MNNVETSIERLRVSRANVFSRREAEGIALGKQWAQDKAEYDELERVSKMDTANLLDQDGSYLKEFAAAVLDDDNPSWDETHEAVENLFGRNDPSLAEVRGFIAGATEIFDQV